MIENADPPEITYWPRTGFERFMQALMESIAALVVAGVLANLIGHVTTDAAPFLLALATLATVAAIALLARLGPATAAWPRLFLVALVLSIAATHWLDVPAAVSQERSRALPFLPSGVGASGPGLLPIVALAYGAALIHWGFMSLMRRGLEAKWARAHRGA